MTDIRDAHHRYIPSSHPPKCCISLSPRNFLMRRRSHESAQKDKPRNPGTSTPTSSFQKYTMNPSRCAFHFNSPYQARIAPINGRRSIKSCIDLWKEWDTLLWETTGAGERDLEGLWGTVKQAGDTRLEYIRRYGHTIRVEYNYVEA